MLNTGLRLAHILDIKFSDIDFNKGHLQTVNKRSLSGEEKINIKLSDTSLIFLAKIRDKYPDDTRVFQTRKNDIRIKKRVHCLKSQAVIDKIKLILISFDKTYHHQINACLILNNKSPVLEALDS